MVRQKVKDRPKATGKQLRLFHEGQDDISGPYRYSCYVTNLTLPPAEVWRLYRGRAMAENRIKELKYDYNMDKINAHKFDVTETALNFLMIAYNLMSLFKQIILQRKMRPMLKTIRYTCLNIPSYLVKNGNQTILKMALHMRRRSWILNLWARTDNIASPYLKLQT